jgi:hypothetical protein
MVSLRGWDIFELAWDKSTFVKGAWGAKGNCAETVTVNGKCYKPEEVNYLLWGLANRLCKREGVTIMHPMNASGEIGWNYHYELEEALDLVRGYRLLFKAGTGIPGRVAWTRAGWWGGLEAPSVSLPCMPCPFSYDNTLWAYIGSGYDIQTTE